MPGVWFVAVIFTVPVPPSEIEVGALKVYAAAAAETLPKIW